MARQFLTPQEIQSLISRGVSFADIIRGRGINPGQNLTDDQGASLFRTGRAIANAEQGPGVNIDAMVGTQVGASLAPAIAGAPAGPVGAIMTIPVAGQFLTEDVFGLGKPAPPRPFISREVIGNPQTPSALRVLIPDFDNLPPQTQQRIAAVADASGFLDLPGAGKIVTNEKGQKFIDTTQSEDAQIGSQFRFRDLPSLTRGRAPGAENRVSASRQFQDTNIFDLPVGTPKNEAEERFVAFREGVRQLINQDSGVRQSNAESARAVSFPKTFTPPTGEAVPNESRDRWPIIDPSDPFYDPVSDVNRPDYNPLADYNSPDYDPSQDPNEIPIPETKISSGEITEKNPALVNFALSQLGSTNSMIQQTINDGGGASIPFLPEIREAAGRVTERQQAIPNFDQTLQQILLGGGQR